jgi:hypothetical protein
VSRQSRSGRGKPSEGRRRLRWSGVSLPFITTVLLADRPDLATADQQLPEPQRRTDRLYPWWVITAAASASLVLVLSDPWKRGPALAGSTLLVAAVIRWRRPTGRAGLLAVRSRIVDVTTYTILGGGLLGMTLVAPLG